MAPAERRAAIVDAARPLVMRYGSAVTTRQIAEAGGIAEGTIFRVFPDKESVVQAVVAEVFDPEPTLRELAAVDRGLPLRERLVAATAVLQGRLSQVFGLLDALGWIRPTGGRPHRRRSTTLSGPRWSRSSARTSERCGCRPPSWPTCCGCSSSPAPIR
jgi:AcrR family transcriptional regulator